MECRQLGYEELLTTTTAVEQIYRDFEKPNITFKNGT